MSDVARLGGLKGRNMVHIFSSTSVWVPDFTTIYNHHRLSVGAICLEGRVPRAAVACMLVKIAVPQEMAQKVLDGVNKICVTNYTLDDVRISLVEEDMATEPFCRDRPVPSRVEIEPILPDFVTYVQRVMHEHGGKLEVVTESRQIAHFPPGTIKRFIWPACYNWRYDVYFPDGYCILLVEFRDGRVGLGFDPKEFPFGGCNDNSQTLDKLRS